MHRNAVIRVALIAILGLLSLAPDSAQAAKGSAFAKQIARHDYRSTSQRRLYLVVSPGQTISYPVGVGRAGKQWSGTSYISSKHIKPAWSPPRRLDTIVRICPTCSIGSPRNPMGAAALVLAHGQYAIHGTNAPGSIGGFVSYGCIRMHNGTSWICTIVSPWAPGSS